jgi:AcrR family transcriptional regulator
VDAATAVFEERGYLDATVDEIVKHAGASRPTFYAYFDGKAQVLAAVVAKMQLRSEYLAILERFRGLSEPTIDALQVWFDEYVEFYQRNLAIHEAIHQAQVMDREFASAMLHTLQSYVDLWASVGFVKDPKDDDLRLAALMLYALGDQFMYLWLVHGLDLDRKKATRALASALYGTLRPGGGADR